MLRQHGHGHLTTRLWYVKGSSTRHLLGVALARAGQLQVGILQPALQLCRVRLLPRRPRLCGHSSDSFCRQSAAWLDRHGRCRWSPLQWLAVAIDVPCSPAAAAEAAAASARTAASCASALACWSSKRR